MASDTFKASSGEFRELGSFIVADPAICGGKPTFKGTRVMLWQVLDQVAAGMPWEQISWSWRDKFPTPPLPRRFNWPPPISRIPSPRMFLLDENVSELEVSRLRKWGIRVRLIGDEVADIGTSDGNLLPALLRLKQPVLFTQDEDFFRRSRLHSMHAAAWYGSTSGLPSGRIHPSASEASRIRRSGEAARFVARVNASGIAFWRQGSGQA